MAAGSTRRTHSSEGPSGYPDTESLGRVIAHRGASRVAPENTLSAFREAARQGALWLELDVSLLGDGTAVVHHDAALGRVSDRRGPLSALAVGDIAGIDAGGWFGPAFVGEPLATLEQTLDLIEELGISANLEMKLHGGLPEPMALTVTAALAARAWAGARILVSSFDLGALGAMRRLRPAQPLAVLYTRPPPDWPRVLARLRARSLHIRHEALDEAILARARAGGFHVRVYTINEPARVARFRELGLTGVITDHPPLFLDDPAWAAWARSQAE